MLLYCQRMGSVKYHTRFAVEIISRLLNSQNQNDCTLAFKKAASVPSSFVPRLSIWAPRSLWLWTNFFGRAKRAADKLVVLGTPCACSLSTRHTLHFHLTCTLHYKRHAAGGGRDVCGRQESGVTFLRMWLVTAHHRDSRAASTIGN